MRLPATALRLGVLRGPKEVSGSILHRISHTSQIAVRETASIGGDFEGVARGLVVGAIEGARKMGVSRAEAAAAAADGALKAAHSLGSPAFETVQNAVTQSVHGVKVVMKKPELAMPIGIGAVDIKSPRQFDDEQKNLRANKRAEARPGKIFGRVGNYDRVWHAQEILRRRFAVKKNTNQKVQIKSRSH